MDGLIHGGAYLRNFTVILPQPSNTSDVQLRVQIVNLSEVVYRPPESGSLRSFLVCWKKLLFAQRSCSSSATATWTIRLTDMFNLKQHVVVPTHSVGVVIF